jgi:hypothetical protein
MTTTSSLPAAAICASWLLCHLAHISTHLIPFSRGWYFSDDKAKEWQIFQLKLKGNGTALASDPIELFHSEIRYRDLAFNPDGTMIHVITDSLGPVQAIEGGPIANIKNPGSLIEFR